MQTVAEPRDFASVRQRTSELIHRAAYADQPALIEAPPSSGKTTSAFQLALDADVPPITYYAGRTDLYEQANQWAEQQEKITCEIVPSPHRDCPTFRGDTHQDSRKIKRLYNKGYSACALHMLPPQQAYTPCRTPGCEYMHKLDRLDEGLEHIDLLIGHHSHARREKYNRDRLVILDEFNPNPFLTSFPSEDSDIIDDPGEIIPQFLSLIQSQDEFPSEEYRDITDILEQRARGPEQLDVLDWFRTHGASRDKVEEYDFLDPSARAYDRTHLRAPLLTLSLFCMERVGPGFELAPGPSGAYDEIWRDANLHYNVKCLRNRNTGVMHVLRSPDLSSATQVIGLDGLPTRRLWNLLFSSDVPFEHYSVIDREDYPAFLRSALNMSVIQLGDGMHHYAGGQQSKFDRYRFETVRLREDSYFALISTKNALENYHRDGLLNKYVLQDGTEDSSGNKRFPDRKARHYGIIKSSNDFADESLGVVVGTPHPGDSVIQKWAGFCGSVTEPQGKGADKEFGGATEEIYRHFVHNQVIQAILRFGRAPEVRENEGSTVYVSTEGLPPWFEVDEKIGTRKHTKESAIISEILDQARDDSEAKTAHFTVSLIQENTGISRNYIRNTLEQLVDESLLQVRRNHAKGGADLYSWDGQDRYYMKEDSNEAVLLGDENTYIT